MREREIQDHLRPELRRSPEEKRHERRKEDRIVWGNLLRRINPDNFFIFISSHSLVWVEIFTNYKTGF